MTRIEDGMHFRNTNIEVSQMEGIYEIVELEGALTDPYEHPYTELAAEFEYKTFRATEVAEYHVPFNIPETNEQSYMEFSQPKTGDERALEVLLDICS